ncbi:MAG: hypothetical protein US62_C0007G0028 [Candidatus Woesebacteria bacterium GW2011_GWA1_37_8]|uniref:Uncharacterized protein n=2 Tax=Candidatus Woeseibacteriota TaxID=1752722 RepID=A0A0G0NMZ6_9BACT|nr:MAG: hypothetical protein US39_C0001G0111 [Microgenomates group bacterium GW2011_GWC1_37_12b]KKQ45953.1 MAG: hypothetical protein US62_C0007G0028 [Candidatus Woesebacteria bacterium GW2011_GWA1_37_8]KKQ87264.1 MAG: hypothetical protein UT10_C0008G0025 [Candidatus Woesebacteria bacterium GW2011_GWB1_38_8b]
MNKILGMASTFFGIVWLLKTIPWLLRFLNGIGECSGLQECDSLLYLFLAIIFSLFVYWGLKVGYELVIALQPKPLILWATRKWALLYIIINLIFFFYLLSIPRVPYFLSN